GPLQSGVSNVPTQIRCLVAMLDQEPLPVSRRDRRALPSVNEYEFPMQFLPVERKFDLATLQLMLHGHSIQQVECAAIPYHHRASSIMTVGDHSLKAGVFDRMILCHHSEPLVRWIERRSFGNRPAQQHSIALQPEVIVEARGSVLLYNE